MKWFYAGYAKAHTPHKTGAAGISPTTCAIDRVTCFSNSAADIAVKKLQRSGFDMQEQSIVGKDDHTEKYVCGDFNLGNRIKRR